MSALRVRPGLIDAAGRAEMLAFISRWLDGPNHAQLLASKQRFVSVHSHGLVGLRNNLASCTFLLGHHDGEQLFGTNTSTEQP